MLGSNKRVVFGVVWESVKFGFPVCCLSGLRVMPVSVVAHLPEVAPRHCLLHGR